jgi:hypothetical protein
MRHVSNTCRYTPSTDPRKHTVRVDHSQHFLGRIPVTKVQECDSNVGELARERKDGKMGEVASLVIELWAMQWWGQSSYTAGWPTVGPMLWRKGHSRVADGRSDTPPRRNVSALAMQNVPHTNCPPGGESGQLHTKGTHPHSREGREHAQAQKGQEMDSRNPSGREKVTGVK